VILGPRFLIEAGFIIAVAVVAGLERLGTWSIIGVVAAAWIVVALVELAVWFRSIAKKARATQPERQPAAAPRPAVVHAEPVQAPEPPRIAAAPPPPEPEPAAEPLQQAEPEQQPEVAELPMNEEPREWNLWELERAARDHATDDVVRNEERAYLLMYLREFAGPDGTLPADFDGLVRDAFGDLVRTVAT
jgi:type IV secretory pathway VirB10-like protein